MAFRRAQSHAHHRSQAWHGWIARYRAELAAIGLPAEVYLDEGRWGDLLENGSLDWHESSGFAFRDLSAGQLTALLRFLERGFGASGRCPPLLGYVRVPFGAQ